MAKFQEGDRQKIMKKSQQLNLDLIKEPRSSLERREPKVEAIVCPNNGLMENRTILKVMRLTQRATIPTKGSIKAAGYDLYSAHEYSIAPGTNGKVLTDIAVKFPPNSYGRIAPRSSLALEKGILIGGGVIDPDYTGNIGIIMYNGGKQDFVIHKGDRCAQMVVERIYMPQVMEVGSLEHTVRGSSGFGSTGKN